MQREISSSLPAQAARDASRSHGWWQQHWELRPIISATTRPPRQTERPDEDYRYMSEEQFNRLAQKGAFLQKVVIGRYQYGILKQDMDEALAAGGLVSLVLNREGTDAVKQIYGDRVVRIFVYVDKTTMQERLESKGASYEQIASYLDHYADEVTYRKHCEYIFENVDLTRTAERIIEQLRSLANARLIIRAAPLHARVRNRPLF